MTTTTPRKKGPQFIQHWRTLKESPAWQASLSWPPLAMLINRIEIEHLRHAGRDNGLLPVTHENFEECGIDRNHIKPAITAGVALGLIAYTSGKAGRRCDERAVNTFRLTSEPVRCSDGTIFSEATNDWSAIETMADAMAIIASCKPRRKPRMSRDLPKNESVNAGLIPAKNESVNAGVLSRTSTDTESKDSRITGAEIDYSDFEGSKIPAADSLSINNRHRKPKSHSTGASPYPSPHIARPPSLPHAHAKLHRLPDDWKPGEANYEWAKARGKPRLWVDDVADAMRDWALSKGECREDWGRTLNAFMRRRLEDESKQPKQMLGGGYA